MTTWRWLVLSLVCGSARCAAADLPGLTAALRELHMTPHDLSFQKDLVPSAFVQPPARHFLQHPTALAAEADRFLARAATATNLTAVAALVAPVPSSSPRAPRVAMDRLVQAARRAQRRLPRPDPSAWTAFQLDQLDDAPADSDLRRRHDQLELQDDELAHLILAGADRFDRSELPRAFGALLTAVADVIATWPDAALPPQTIATDLGPIIIGSPGPDTYRADAFLILDPGGDDVYENAAGGANGLRGRPLAIVIDWAGNDRYVTTQTVAHGAGVFGIGILVDLAGDDVYQAHHVAQGAAFYGAGLLADLGGTDTMTAGTHAQGAAMFGVGVLWQRGGPTQYQIASLGQGYGGTLGHGLLLDQDGDDTYVARGAADCGWLPGHKFTLAQGFGYGMRPFAGGGVGVLCDLRGNDRYQADVYGQGASYWYAVGLLIDAAGADQYTAFQYCQGAGIHLSSGALVDAAGHDTYTAGHICQGAAHDYAVGLLVDRGGDDRYTGATTAQGAALNNSFALLLDQAGNDSYAGADPKHSQAAGHDGDRREYGAIAVLLDLAGTDTYSQGQTNGMTWLKPWYGVGLDTEWPPEPPVVGPVPLPRPGWASPRSFPAARWVDVHHPIERLIRRVASDPHVWDELKQLGAPALAYWLTRLDSPDVTVRANAEQFVDQLGTNAVPVLMAGIRHAPSDEAARVACYLLARFDEQARAAVPVVLPLLRHEATQATALYTLGHLRARQAVTPAIRLLRDDRELVRLRAAQALGRIGDQRAVRALRPLVRDELWTVRFAAARALEQLGDPGGAGVIPPVKPPPAWPH